MFVTLFAGACFIFISYLAHLVHPDFTSYKNLDTAAIEVAKLIGGTFFNALLSLQWSFVPLPLQWLHMRVYQEFYSQWAEIPLFQKVFAYIHPKFKTPVNNIVLVSIFALAALFTDLVTITSFINFGALIAFTFVNLSVIAHYFIKGKQRSLKGIVLYLIIPLIGAIISIKLWTDLDSKSMTLGGIWTAVGIAYLAYKTKLFRVQPPQLDFTEDSSNDITI